MNDSTSSESIQHQIDILTFERDTQKAKIGSLISSNGPSNIIDENKNILDTLEQSLATLQIKKNVAISQEVNNDEKTSSLSPPLNVEAVKQAVNSANAKNKIEKEHLENLNDAIDGVSKGLKSKPDISSIITNTLEGSKNDLKVSKDRLNSISSITTGLVKDDSTTSSSSYASLSSHVAAAEGKVKSLQAELLSYQNILKTLIEERVPMEQTTFAQDHINEIESELKQANYDLDTANTLLEKSSHSASNEDFTIASLNDKVISSQNEIYARLLIQEDTEKAYNELINSLVPADEEDLKTAKNAYETASQDLKKAEEKLTLSNNELTNFKVKSALAKSTAEIRSNFERLQKEYKVKQTNAELHLLNFQNKQLQVNALSLANIGKNSNDESLNEAQVRFKEKYIYIFYSLIFIFFQ